MAVLPIPPNIVCAIYHVGNAPPAAPNIANVPCYLAPRGQSALTTPYFTHEITVPLPTDLRDDYAGAATPFTPGPNTDTVYIPDGGGVAYKVVLVRRYFVGTPAACLKALLKRQAVTWPNPNI